MGSVYLKFVRNRLDCFWESIVNISLKYADRAMARLVVP